MIRKVLILLSLALSGFGAYYFFLRPAAKKQQIEELIYEARAKDFTLSVTATGELKAKRSIKIQGPQTMRAAGIYQTAISDLVPEGVLVKAGDYVATLDRSEIAGKLANVRTEIERIQTQLEQARIDTAIDMRALRDEIVNLSFSKKEKLLNLEQSRYEPQSVIQQVQLELERVERDYQQLLTKYKLKQQQSEAKIQEIQALLRQNQQQLDLLTDVSDGFTIKAPDEGMVIYARTWSGKKEPGSQISAWDPVVAELPDLTDMISTTYVNEVDVSRIKEGQEVKIGVDAFPDRRYSGMVIRVANIGEQLRGFDAKVFEVVVQINESDSILRPAMTTSNEIITDVIPNVMSIPLEALHNDSLSYVYKKENNRLLRQEVIVGLFNDREIIVEYGLSEGDVVLLGTPAKPGELPFVAVPEKIKDEIRRKQEEDQQRRQAEAMRRRERARDVPTPNISGGGSGGIIIIE
jgi:hypothetical protein